MLKILHYSLGFPPYRTGGLTKFCMDLMKQQVDSNHEAALLWPGKMGFFCHNTLIKDRGVEEYDGAEIKSFEVIDPLPVSYDEGINAFDIFTAEGNVEVYKKFLEDYRPDVIHIHTLMGLHKAFLQAAKEKGIRLVFTAHDFFPICPKVTMFRDGHICDHVADCSKCGECNMTALSVKKMQILQLPLYRKIKNISFVKKIRKFHRDEYLSESRSNVTGRIIGTSEDFKHFRSHYESMLKLMDIIHYNSSVTRDIYEKFLGKLPSVVIPISHANISDRRRVKTFSDELIRMRYLGPYGKAKGFFYLKETLDKLWREKKNFCLDVHFEPSESSPYIRTHERYNYSELEKIFDETDVLIVPSVLYETFGYTVLEALSYGVPVIITKIVGAKDILGKGAGIIIDDIKSDQLLNTLKTLDADNLRAMNKCIVDDQKILVISEMEKIIESKCYCK